VSRPEAVPSAEAILDERAADFYRAAMRVLDDAGTPYLVGGSFAFACYTGISGRTKDLDLFVRPSDVDAAIRALADAGYQTEMHRPTWIAKATRGDDLVDVIFSSGNDLARVDEEWFEHARPARALGRRVRLIPMEEMIWSKGFVMERERYDGADVIHLIRAGEGRLDWDRLLRRFGHHWRVLLAHIVLFDYVFPSERHLVGADLRRELLQRAQQEADEPPLDKRICYGSFLSRHQYRIDLERDGFSDARTL
jgi:hypothetical protein